MTPISLCMIVRDEEALLGRCLESVKDVVDEICILDTGSKDKTVEIAEQHGARVESFEWCSDFSAARNASLKLATHDWILVIDADETLKNPEEARTKLQTFMKAHAGKAGHIQVENSLGGGDSSNTRVTRFFPSGTDWKFEGRIHEQILFKGSTPQRAFTELAVDHVGYSPELMQEKDKVGRNEKLLCEALAADPSDSYTAYQLGRTLVQENRFAEALEALELSVEHVADDAAYIGHLFETAASCLRELGHSEQALAWLSNIEAQFRDRADTCFLIALLAMDTGELDRAKSGFEHCLTLAGTTPRGGVSWPAASTWAAQANLGVLAEALYQPDEAKSRYQAALATNPEHEASLAGLARLT